MRDIMKKLNKTELEIESCYTSWELNPMIKLWKSKDLPDGHYVGVGHASIMQSQCNGYSSVLFIVKNVKNEREFEIVESHEDQTLKNYRMS